MRGRVSWITYVAPRASVPLPSAGRLPAAPDLGTARPGRTFRISRRSRTQGAFRRVQCATRRGRRRAHGVGETRRGVTAHAYRSVPETPAALSQPGPSHRVTSRVE